MAILVQVIVATVTMYGVFVTRAAACSLGWRGGPSQAAIMTGHTHSLDYIGQVSDLPPWRSHFAAILPSLKGGKV